MKGIVKLYLNYLELMFIGMLGTALALTLVAGVLTGGIALVPACLANMTLVVLGQVALGRRKALAEHPDIKSKSFKESRLFLFALRSKYKLVLIATLLLVTLGAAYSTDRLLQNQAIVEANTEIPATFFNRSLIIQVIEISAQDDTTAPTVTAILHSNGYPDPRIERQAV